MGDFGFAFNDFNFSDRVLRLEILNPTIDGRDNIIVKVINLKINSRLLSSQSHIFCKLFDDQKDVTLKIDKQEEAALMDILNYMYINILSATTIPELQSVLIVAHNFGVTSCINYCIQKLPELARHCKPCSYALMDDSVRHLKDAAKKYLFECYQDFTGSEEEAMGLPLSALEVVLLSDGLQVRSEDDVFDFIFRWSRAHYPKLEERREVITKRLARLVCFPRMSSWKAEQDLRTCPEIELPEVRKLTCLGSYLKFPHGQHILVRGDEPGAASRLIKRVYTCHPIHLERIESCSKKTKGYVYVVYMCLTKGEMWNLLESKQRYSLPFFVGGVGKKLCLCLSTRSTSLDKIGLFLYRPADPKYDVTNYTIDYEFAVSKNKSREFETKQRVDNCALSEGEYVGKENLLELPCVDDYFVDGILYLQVKLALKDHSEIGLDPMELNNYSHSNKIELTQNKRVKIS